MDCAYSNTNMRGSYVRVSVKASPTSAREK